MGKRGGDQTGYFINLLVGGGEILELILNM